MRTLSKRTGVIILSLIILIAIWLCSYLFLIKQRLNPNFEAVPTPIILEESGERIRCNDPRPEMCTMECIQNPPYICGSDERSYCSVCQACSTKQVEWYEMKDSACGVTEEILAIPISDFSQGWYWGSSTQKKEGTPEDWIFSGNGSRNDCWHEPKTQCGFLPD